MLPLRPSQIEDLSFGIAHERWLNLSDPGTGKTPTTCVWLYYQWSELGRKSVWSQPKSLMYKNADELLRFTEFQPEDVVVLENDSLSATPAQQRSLTRYFEKGKGRVDKRLKRYPQYWRRLARGETIDLIAEFQGKVILCGFRFMARFKERLVAWGCRALAVDEMHMGYGSHDSQNTESLYYVLQKAPAFCGMTGTLLNGRLDSVFPAIHVIEPLYYGGYWGFRQQHVAFEDDYGNVLTWKNEGKVGEILLRHSVRHTFQEVYGKEPVVFLQDRVEMTDAMRESYDLFHDQAMLELEDGFIDGSLPGVATIRARQIMQHPESMKLCKGEVTGKDERLIIHTQDAIQRGEKQLIFSVYQPEQERLVYLLQTLGRRVGLINANTSATERARIDADFRAGRLDDVVGSPACMGVGWNWEHVDHVIYMCLDYTDVTFLQAYRRASRGNRTTTLRVTVMEYYNSLDQRVQQIVTQKSILANKVDPTRPILTFA
jgi:hypothetical protein